MRRLHVFLTGALLLAIAPFGCENGKHKQEVYQHWNDARAAVQGSLAAERYKLGNIDDSRKAVDEAIKLAPENATYRILSARLHIERNQLEAADQELATARKLAPKNGEPDYLSGIVYQRWQKPELALQYYETACTKSPGELQYLMARAEMLVQLKRNEDAISLLEEKLTYFEYSGPLRDLLGGLYEQRGDTAKATEMYYQATILSPEDTSMREHLARSYMKVGKYADALKEFETLLKLDDYKERSDLYMLKGDCHLQLQQFRDARSAFETSLEKNANSVAALLGLYRASIRTNDIDRAEISVRKALALDANEPQAHIAMGQIRLQQKRFDDSIAAFQRAAQLDPKDAGVVAMIGVALEKKGESQKAIEYYAKALQMDPEQRIAKSGMATIK